MKNLEIKENKIKIDEGERRTGKDEMNLIELPFTLLSKRNPNILKTIDRRWIGKDENGKDKEFYKIITGSEKYGLPTFIGEEVFLACMSLSSQQGFSSTKISTTKYELIKLMGWIDNGGSYKRLMTVLNQLGGIWIHTNAFWDNKEKKYLEKGFGILQGYSFSGEKRKGESDYLIWNEIFFRETIKKGNIKSLDIEFYYSLESNISKRLYRFVEKRLYEWTQFEMDLWRLAFEKLEMVGTSYKKNSKIIQNLQPAIKELKEKGIADITILPSSTESGYKVSVKKIDKSSRIILVSQTEEKKNNEDATELIIYFHKQVNFDLICTPTNKEIVQAKELLLKYSKEQIKQIIDYAVKKAKQTNFRMQYFGAVLNYCDKATSERKQEENKKELKKQQKENEQLEQKYKDYQQEIVDAYILSLDKEKFEKEKNRIIEQAKLEGIPNFLITERFVEGTFSLQIIEEGILNILGFEEWKKGTSFS